MKKCIAIAAGLCLALSLGACGGSSAKKDGGSATAAQTQGQAAQKQTFESEAALITYRDKMEATPGNAMVNFALENRTDATVVASAENVVINGEYSVGTLGGSAAPIAPGTTGSVSILFGYTTQTPLQSIGEIHSLTCDIVMRDNGALSNVVGSVPVSVEL